MKKEFVSIVIPTYNRKNKILSCMDSLLDQDYENYEIIVVDDGSTDGTFSLLKKNFSKNRKVKLFRQKNSGPAKARNLGVSKSKGKIVGFTDDDCLPTTNWISSAMKHFQKKEVLGIMGKTIFNGVPYLDKNKRYVGYLTCNMFYRREPLAKVKGFDEKYPFPQREDTDLAWKILKLGELSKEDDVVVVHPDYQRNKNWKIFSSDVLLQSKFPYEYGLFAKEGGCAFIKNPLNWMGILKGIFIYKRSYPLMKIFTYNLTRKWKYGL